MLWCCSLATALHAQVTSSGQEGEKKRLVVRTNGAPIPFATVLNTSTGQAMAADAQGVVMFPAWGPTDTLRVQSLGYEELTVVPGASPLSTLELQPAMFAIEEVVVASNALTGTAMSNMGVSQVAKLTTRAPVLTTETTGDLLEGSGQVHLQMSQQGGVSPVLRGFEANRVLLVVDGVRMNNAIYRAGHVQNAGTVDPFAIQRTDVIMGPSSVLYGSDALGGVVHFVTQAPRFSYGGTEVKGKVLTQGNTANGGWAGHAEVAVRAPRWGSVTQVSHRHFGDLRMGSWRAHGDSTWGLVTHLVERRAGRDVLVDNADPEIQAPTGYSQWDIQQRMRLRLREGFVDVNVQHSTTTDVPRFDVYNDRVGALPKWAEWRYGPQERTMLAVTHQKAFSGGWVWTTLGSLQDVEGVSHQKALCAGRQDHPAGKRARVGLDLGLEGTHSGMACGRRPGRAMEPDRVVCHGHRHRDRRPEFGPNQVCGRRVFHEHLGGVRCRPNATWGPTNFEAAFATAMPPSWRRSSTPPG